MTRKRLIGSTFLLGLLAAVGGYFIWIPCLKLIVTLLELWDLPPTTLSPAFIVENRIEFSFGFFLFAAVPGLAALIRKKFASNSCYRETFLGAWKLAVALLLPIMALWLISCSLAFSVPSLRSTMATVIDGLGFTSLAVTFGTMLAGVAVLGLLGDRLRGNWTPNAQQQLTNGW